MTKPECLLRSQGQYAMVGRSEPGRDIILDPPPLARDVTLDKLLALYASQLHLKGAFMAVHFPGGYLHSLK